MTCPECHQANREGARFCDHCGTRLLVQCPACGTALRPAARFCDECGHAVGSAPGGRPDAARSDGTGAADGPPPRPPAGYTPKHLADKILRSRSALEGERKLVTVLFGDCAGFTALSSRLDPEELHNLMDGCFQRVLEAVHRYEGTVNQFTGDGIMALFGAPIAHEDHAVRAVAAALAIQNALCEYGAAVRAERGLDFALRIGLNTGPVVVGRIGDDLRMDYTAQGETVNLAARLQGATAPGGILVSESTHRLVSGYFVTEETGPLELKGFSRPVRGFTVTGQRTRRARFDTALERGLTPLIGRTTELALLRASVDKARGGRGHAVSLVGEAGVGKSRLAWELREQLRGTPVTYLEGHGLPHTQALPLHLVVQLLEANFRIEDGEPERSKIEKVEAGVHRLDPGLEWTIPYLKHLLSLPAEHLEAAGLDQAQRKRRLTEAVRALTLRGAQNRPLVLVIEDLQWVDASSEEYLASLVDGIAAYPVLLLATHRSGYTPPWQDRPVHQRVTLDPLSEDETLRMVRQLLADSGLAPTVEAIIAQRAEGNPLFVEELIAYLRDRGPRDQPLAEGEVPATIHDLLTARLDRLPDSLKHTLQLASVLGREFPAPLLEAMAPPGHDLARDLAELMRLDLLRETELFPVVRYSFSHLLIQEVAYQGLLLKSRTELHGRAGRALEELYADRPEDVVEALAEHHAKGPDRARAVRYLVRAGERAAGLFAYPEAAAYFERAAGALESGEAADGQRSMILERLGDTADAQGAVTEALARWEAALAVLGPAGHPRRAADLHRKMGGAHWDAGQRDQALAHLDRGLAALGDDRENLEAARLYQELGRIHFRLGAQEEAMEWAERALALGERLNAPDVVAHAYNTTGVVLARADKLEEGAAFVRRSLETALANRLGSVACRAYTNLAVMYATLDPVRSAGYCREGLALAQQIGDQLQQSWLYCALAGGHCTLAGDYEEGVKAAAAAAELDQRLGQRNHLPIPLILRAQIYQCRGDYQRSGQSYREALAVAEAVGEPQLLFPCYEGLATLAIEEGDETEAEAWLAKSRHVKELTGWSSDTFTVLPFLC
jgi:adenylate cyclase